MEAEASGAIENGVAEHQSDDDVSEKDWKPISSTIGTVHEWMENGEQPEEIIKHLMPGLVLPSGLSTETLWHLLVEIITEPAKRNKLADVNTLDDALRLIDESENILVLTGAGVSVSCGIPDFRSRDGIYARLHADFPDLPDPQAMFDIDYFRKNPKPFFNFAKEIYPGKFEPSRTHKFIKLLEDKGKLLRNYTQNIDTLEQQAGIRNVLQCHGSFASAQCLVCKHKVDCEAIREDIENQRVPHCPVCPTDSELSIMKPEIVFFGEDLPKVFHQQMIADKDKVDLLIVIGSSLKVRPVALIPSSIAPEVPQILINRDPLGHMTFDIELLGNCDDVIDEMSYRMGHTALCSTDKTQTMSQIDELPQEQPCTSSSVSSIPPKRQRLSSPLPHLQTEDNPSPSCHREKTPEKEKQDLEDLRQMYKPRLRNISFSLPENTYLFVPPNRYIFPGAEVFEDRDLNGSTSGSESSSSDSSDSEDEETRSLDAGMIGNNKGESDSDDGRKSCDF